MVVVVVVVVVVAMITFYFRDAGLRSSAITKRCLILGFGVCGLWFVVCGLRLMVRVCDNACEGGWMPEAAVGAGAAAGLVDGEWLVEQQELLVQVALSVKTLNSKR